MHSVPGSAFFIDKVARKNIQCVAIAFADDTDFMTEGEDAQTQMQEILDVHNRMCASAGGQIEEVKTSFYAWQSKWKQGQKVAHNIDKELTVNKRKIKQTDADEGIKTLGVRMTPALKWVKQYEMMKEKCIKQ